MSKTHRLHHPLPPDVEELYRHIDGATPINYTNFVSQSLARQVMRTWPALLPKTPDESQ